MHQHIDGLKVNTCCLKTVIEHVRLDLQGHRTRKTQYGWNVEHSGKDQTETMMINQHTETCLSGLLYEMERKYNVIFNAVNIQIHRRKIQF